MSEPSIRYAPPMDELTEKERASERINAALRVILFAQENLINSENKKVRVLAHMIESQVNFIEQEVAQLCK